jgi:hypothetical protein
MTSAVEPGAGEARLREWIATERGSRRAAASKEMWSGNLVFLLAPNSSFFFPRKNGGDILMTPNRGMVNSLL